MMLLRYEALDELGNCREQPEAPGIGESWINSPGPTKAEDRSTSSTAGLGRAGFHLVETADGTPLARLRGRPPVTMENGAENTTSEPSRQAFLVTVWSRMPRTGHYATSQFRIAPISFRRSADWAPRKQHHAAWWSRNIKCKPGNEQEYG